MRFDFTDLNLFRHIVEAGSITAGCNVLLHAMLERARAI